MKTTVFHFVYATAKKVLPISIASRLRSAGTAFITPLRFSIAKGHSRSSFLCLAVDSKGNPLPWYTYPTIDFLRVRDFSQKTVLEFGGGQSTLWRQARAKSVLTIEENDDWARMLSTKNRENAITIYIPVDRESRSVENVKKLSICGLEKFDIIFIDGHLRKELAKIAYDYLADDGAIIMDKSEGYGFYEATKSKRLLHVDFFGFSPGASLEHATSILFRSRCFLFSPDIPIYDIEDVK